ncbi:anti-sigma factor domain-containing protein [Rothia halotolerans]|uniref:anti-sigma factor n=1 Tax=Rothia halotolerans TaxID=405770 RepID=UPI00101B7154|nr:anti-sigma factor [Rothia halotolerans]
MVNERADGSGRADDVHADAVLYAVDALDAAEARAFEEHLAGCTRCREEVDSFRETGAELAGAAAVDPPPELRESVLGAIRATRPDAGEVEGASGTVVASSSADREDDTASARASTAADQDAAGTASSPATSAPTGPRHADPQATAAVHSLDARRRRGRWVLAAAAAVVVPGVALGGWALGQHSGQQEQRVVAQEHEQERQRQERLLAAADVAVRHVEMDGGGTATVIASRDRDAVLLVASGVADPGEGRQYQLWLMEDGTPVPDATFDAGAAGVWVDGDLEGAQALAVTVEPEGGSESPTSDPLMVAEI